MRVSLRIFKFGLVPLAAFAALTSCSSPNSEISLTGAGATFPAPIYQRWFNEYQSVAHVQINYQPIGSGGGIRAITEGTVDFGASDMPLSDPQLSAYQQKHGYPVLLFPTVLGAAVPAYNLAGISQDLNFTPEALAGIFLGTIKSWNDPAITSVNRGVKLPASPIVVVHRSDGSGTTFCWTDYLSKISPEWSSKIGKNTSVNWPVGLGAKGNDGVAGLIKQQPGSIGYVELIYAVQNHLPYGKVRNSAGEFVKADLQSVTAAAAALKSTPSDLRVSITDEPGNGVYPISTFTWLLVPQKISNPAQQKAMIGFLKWAITTGQNSVEALNYARLPQSFVDKEQQQLAKIQ